MNLKNGNLITYKKGQNLYSYYFNDKIGKIELFIYKISFKRQGYVYAINLINGVTWGKRSTKNGDFGWLKNIDSCFKRKTLEGTQFYNLHTTKLKACLNIQTVIKKQKNDIDFKVYKKVMAEIKRKITMLRKLKKESNK